jgi:mitochondrial chaperone BCS1
LLFEDLDCMRSSRSRSGQGPEEQGATLGKPSEQNGVTLSGLLNLLDGFCAPAGVLFVMTTNHVEKLDPALLRPGRIDYKLYMGGASSHQKAELYRRFFPTATHSEALEFVEASASAETMAEFQGLLLALEQEKACDLTPANDEVLA